MKPRYAILLLALLLGSMIFVVNDRGDSPEGTLPSDQEGAGHRPGAHQQYNDSLSANGPGSKSRQHLEDGRVAGKIITTPSGLQYQVLFNGSGPRPGPTDLVQANYTGTLDDGTVFDASKPDTPLTLPLDQVIPGWQEGLQLMPSGSKFRFTIPSELAYGEKGAGDKIPPNATLTFEIELLKIIPRDN